MLNEKRKEEVIALCQELVHQYSYSGNEKAAADVLKKYFMSHGFDDVTIDRYGNVIGVIHGKRKGIKLLFDGHIDTVPVPDPSKWKYDPFRADIADGKLYGRGTSDMKGADAAMAVAAASYAEDTQKDFAGDIYVAGVVHEECFEGVAARSISSFVQPDVVVIGEASGLNLKIGQRGRGEVVVETFGVPAHSANPEKGVNAVYSMCRLIEAIRKLPATHDDFLGDGILELTDIKSSPYPGASVVPDYCRATYDRRLLVGETKESVLHPIQELIDKMSAENLSFKAKVSFAAGREKCYTGECIEGERFFPGWKFSEQDACIQKILKTLHEMGFHPEITKYNFCTNGSHYAGEAGIKTIGMGPSRENLAHTIDEYIELDQLTGVTERYMGIMKALL
ncbi:MAG: YgeY family selenium metabolism-linked hydrolase [Eubacterium sp.]|nr:YgeY family selenium metabolism-linked hydrolase [Eubacterium sp.]